MKRRYLVIYECAGKNFSGYAPDVPGCIATGKTLAKMRSTLKDALESHLQWMHDDGDSIPKASPAVTVELEDDPEFPNPSGYYLVVEKLEVLLPTKKRSVAHKNPAREAIPA